MRVIGLTELTTGLLREAADAPRAASDVVSEVAQHVKDTAKSMAPVLTGALAASIHVSVVGNRGTREVGPSVDYGLFVEYGTAHMAPQPYMGPAADAHEHELEEGLAKRVGEL